MRPGAALIVLFTLLLAWSLALLSALPTLARGALSFGAEWPRGALVAASFLYSVLGLMALARHLSGRPHDNEARLRRAPFVGSVAITSGLLYLATVAGPLSGEAAGVLRAVAVVLGLFLLLVLGLPSLFARQLDAAAKKALAQAPATAAPPPPACKRCGTTLSPEAAACSYCGAPR